MWAAGRAFEWRNLRIGIRTDDARFLTELGGTVPPVFRRSRSRIVDRLYSVVRGTAGDGRLRRFHLVHADAATIARSLDEGAALLALERDLRHFVAEYARGCVFVHAGVVAWRGKALLVPGRSFSGKSRLVAALVKAGATYYSDEYAVLDRRGRVHPFPTPLSLRDEGCEAPDPRLLRPGRRPLPVGLVVLSEYRPGARPRFRRLSPGNGVLAVLAHTVPARPRPAEALTALRHAVARVPVVRATRGEAEEFAATLLRRLPACSGTPPWEQPAWEVSPPC